MDALTGLAFLEDASLIEQLPVAAVVCDREGVVRKYNRRAADLWGRTPMAGERYTGAWRVYLPDGTEVARDRLPAASVLREGKGGRNLELVCERPDGTKTTVVATVSPIMDGAGGVVGVLSCLQDVTPFRRVAERLCKMERRAKEAAERAERQSRYLAESGVRLAGCLEAKEALTVLANVSVPAVADYGRVYVIDGAELRQVACAHRDPGRLEALESFGQRYKIELGNPLSVLGRVAKYGKAELVEDPLEALANSSVVSQGLLEAYRALAPTTFMGVPLVARGNVLGVLLLATDKHSGRRFSEESLALAEELCRRAALAVDNARLYEELGRAGRAKDQFIAALSHELRTPLTPVMMSVSAMEMEPTLSAEVRQDLAMIRRNIELETRLIDDLLDVTRIVNGKLRLQVRPAGVHALVRTVLEICRPEIEDRRLAVACDLSAGDDRVNADPARVQQVLWNLVKNAVKFTPVQGTVTIRTRNEGGSGGASSIVVEVTDTGIGIPAEVLPRIFDAFEQGDRSTTHKFGGLGLGLAISKAIAEMHGGTLTAESEGRGKGARFTLAIPTVAGSAAAGLATPPAAAPAPASQGAVPGLRVLLVEDHADTQRMLKRLLEMRGYVVWAAGSVASALQLAATEPFDVVVSDIGLPDATGLDLMRELKDRRSDVTGIAISGFGMEHDIRSSHDAGFAHHLTKPVDPRQLDAVIRKLVESRIG